MNIELTDAQRSELRRAIGRLEGTTDLTPGLTEVYMKLEPESPVKQFEDYERHKRVQQERMQERMQEPVVARQAVKEEWEASLRLILFKQRRCDVNSNAWWYHEGMRLVAAGMVDKHSS